MLIKRYIVLELCAATMEGFIRKRYTGPVPTDKQVLFQLAEGLEHIHSKGIAHRDVKPENILISRIKPIQMKWCDFILAKEGRSGSSRGSFSVSGRKGTQKWMAPEIDEERQEQQINLRGTFRIDIFSSGCVFLYFLLAGVHPFGSDQHDIRKNIVDGNPVNLKGMSLPKSNKALHKNM